MTWVKPVSPPRRSPTADCLSARVRPCSASAVAMERVDRVSEPFPEAEKGRKNRRAVFPLLPLGQVCSAQNVPWMPQACSGRLTLVSLGAALRRRLTMVSWNASRVGLLAALVALTSVVVAAEKERPTRALPLAEAWRKANCGGKYEMLLRQIRVPGDAEKYGAFHDLGPQRTATHAGHKNLPPGHWVYVAPYWYIWRVRTTDPRPAPRAWGPEQATGKPDTPGAGDIVTAWASATPDGQDEWLLMEYAEPVVPTAVLVHETYNPGALVRVTAFRLDGEEVEVWKGKDPTPVGAGRGISEVKCKA